MSFLDDCSEAVSRWLSLLELTEWRVRVEVRQLPQGYLAVTYPNYDYIEALIAFSDPSVVGAYDLEATAAHEVCHLPMAEFSTQAGTPARRAEERVVERFSRTMVAMLRGMSGKALVALVPKLRAAIGATVRARRAIAAGRYRMDPKLLELLMRAGEFSGRDDVPEDVKELLKQLAGAVAAGGEAPPADPPAAETPPDAPAAEKPPSSDSAPAMQDKPAPAARTAAPGLSAAARASLAAAEKSAKAAETNTAAAAEMARKRLVLEENDYRETLFRSAPDVFPQAVPKLREVYKSAKPDEIERYIAAQRARAEVAQPPPANGRARASNDPVREPPPGGASGVKNEGGVVIRAGGRVVS